MIRKTSVESFKRQNINKNEAIKNTILSALSVGPPKTDTEMCEELFTQYAQINKPRVRRHELYKEGKIMCIGKRKCEITGKMAMIWTIKAW